MARLAAKALMDKRFEEGLVADAFTGGEFAGLGEIGFG